jgi:hypothetical protein
VNRVDPYIVTVENVRHWFDVMNKELFNGKLKIFNKIKVANIPDYAVLYDSKHGTELHIRDRFKNEQHFVETLAHEMVHLNQLQSKQRLGHGKSFKKLKRRFVHKHRIDIAS